MRGLSGKVVIVTGGLGDLGYPAARRLAEEGCKVAIFDLAQDADNRAVAIGCTFYSVDISKEEQVKSACTAVKAALGPVDVLVNCAALFVRQGVDATVADWQKVLSVNVIGTSLMTRYVVPQMKERRRGSIINFSSISGFVGQSGFATYNATKFAIRGLTKCWAQDLGPDNIRVNSICPAYMHTAAFERSCQQQGRRIDDPENRRIAALHLLNRRGRPEEVAGAVAFLASEDSTFITGSDLVVDGGYLAK
jgi:NAD(P)-dependent dehydrogenase (short-subunit alcohol dehydrogenase family)